MDGPLPQCSESDQHEDFDFQVMTGTVFETNLDISFVAQNEPETQ